MGEEAKWLKLVQVFLATDLQTDSAKPFLQKKEFMLAP